MTGAISASLGLIIVVALASTLDLHHRSLATEPLDDADPWTPAERVIPNSMTRDMDFDQDPCNHFNSFTCEGWLSRARIPPSELQFSRAWDTTDNRNKQRLKTLVSEDKGKVGMYYRSCMDLETINKRGVAPLRPYLLEIDTIHTRQELLDVVALLHQRNIAAFFDWDVIADPYRPGKNGFNLVQGGLSLPDATYYTAPEHADVRETYLSVMAKMFEITGLDAERAREEASAAFEVEEAISLHLTPRDVSRSDIPKAHTLEQLEAVAPDLNFANFFKMLTSTTSNPEALLSQLGQNGLANLIYDDDGYLPAINALITSRPVSYFKPYLRWRTAYILGSDLAEEFQLNDLALNKKLDGVTKRVPRWKKCLSSVTTALNDLVGEAYIKEYFDDENRDTALAMLTQIRAVLREKLSTLPWLEEKTRRAAVNKLDHMIFEVAYPERWQTYSFSIRPDTFFENTMHARVFDINSALERLTASVDRQRWGSTSVTEVDAFYSREVNALFVPAGILQGPFFDRGYASARNWGSIGVVLGHEMTHGFDDVGRKFDQFGHLRNWWSASDTEHYDSHAKCIAKQYSGYTIDGVHLNGNLTLAEAIADMGGVKLAYEAFVRGPDVVSKNGQVSDTVRRAVEAAVVAEFADTLIVSKASQSGDVMAAVEKVMENLAKQASVVVEKNNGGFGVTLGEKQLFFMSWGQTWCSVTRPQARVLKLATDEHAPDKYRVIGPLSQTPEFATAFSCPVGSTMHPAHPCVLW